MVIHVTVVLKSTALVASILVPNTAVCSRDLCRMIFPDLDIQRAS